NVLKFSGFRAPYYSFFVSEKQLHAAFLTGSEVLTKWKIKEVTVTFKKEVQRGHEAKNSSDEIWEKLKNIFSKRKALSQNYKPTQSTTNLGDNDPNAPEFVVDCILSKRFNRTRKRYEWLTRWSHGYVTR